MWFMDSFDDVDVETPQEVNLIAYKQIHELLDREIEKASSVTTYNLGVGRTKRETFGEVRSMLSEASDRFQLFIQMADRITLRPIAYRVYALLRETLKVYQGRDFIINGEKVRVDKESLLDDMDVQFAASTIESEHSRYSKQQTFPQVLQILQQIAGDRLNVDEIVRVVGQLFSYNNPERFVFPSQVVPIEILPPQLQQIARNALAQLQEAQTGKKPAASPSLAPAPEGPAGPAEQIPMGLGGGMG
jgi:hypothetical protein